MSSTNFVGPGYTNQSSASLVICEEIPPYSGEFRYKHVNTAEKFPYHYVFMIWINRECSQDDLPGCQFVIIICKEGTYHTWCQALNNVPNGHWGSWYGTKCTQHQHHDIGGSNYWLRPVSHPGTSLHPSLYADEASGCPIFGNHNHWLFYWSHPCNPSQ